MEPINQFLFRAAVFTVVIFFFVFGAFTLTSSGIDQTVADVSSYLDTAFNLIIAIGSLIGLIGSVRVYIEWQGADRNTRKAIMRWFGACLFLFLILVSTFIKAFFK
jgi:hypothetical protein